MSKRRERSQFDELVGRELEGEITGAERVELDELCVRQPALAAERAALAANLAAARDLAAHAPSPPADFTARVMRRLEQPRHLGLWRRLLQPRLVRVRPLALAPAAALLLGLAITLAGTVTRRVPEPARGAEGVGTAATPAPAAAPVVPGAPASAPAPAACDGDVVLVRLVLTASAARRVAVAGDFNGWSTSDTVLADHHGNGVFTVTVPLRRGTTYAYKFLVDGRWTEDPLADAQSPDGFGQNNSLLRL